MNEQLTGKGTSRHTKGMPENDKEELKVEAPVVPDQSLKEKKEIENPKPKIKEVAKEKEETETAPSEEEAVTQEIAAAQEKKEDKDAEFNEIVKDVPAEEISFYKGIWDKLKATFSDKNQLREAIIDETSSHQKRVYSLRGVKDLSTLKSYTNTSGDLFQRYTRVFKQYANSFEGSYRNEFGEGEFSGSSSDLLDRARHEYVAKVKKIVEKARWTRDFNAAQIALSNIEDEVTTRQLQLQQLNPSLYEETLQDTEEPVVKDGHVIAQWPVVKPVEEDSLVRNEQVEGVDAEKVAEEKKEKGKLHIPEEVVRKNAGIQDDDERVEVGVEILKKFEDEEFTPEQKEEIAKFQARYLPDDQFTPEQKEEIQKEAIKAAHHVGGEDKEAHIYNYSHGQLREKYEILQKAGYTRDQIRVLMEHGVVGTEEDREAERIRREEERVRRLDELDARMDREAREADTEVEEHKRRVADERTRETSSGDPQFPRGGETIEGYLREIAINTGLTVEEVRKLKARLDTLIDLNEEHWRTLMKCERQHAGYLRILYDSMERVNMTMEEYRDEAKRQTDLMEAQTNTESEKEKLVKTIKRRTSREELKDMMMTGHSFQRFYRLGMTAYQEAKQGDYEENVFDTPIPAGLSKDEFDQMKRDYYNRVVVAGFDELDRRGETEEVLKQYLLDQADRIATYMDIAEGAPRKERGRSQVNSIEELAEAIMDTHPEYARGTENALLDENDNLSQENFMNWIHSQLQYYHDQDPDEPNVNFLSSISVDLPEFVRSINIFTMINQPGRYFKNKNGVELKGLKDEVTNAAWLWGDIRKKDILYRVIMPMDEKVGEALINMYQNNVLTKMMGDGTPPLHWILSQAEKFGEDIGDKKIGMGILESLMIYYNITDFPELYTKYAGEDSPMFDLNEIEKTVQELIVKEKRNPDDSYLSPEDWAKLRSFFDGNGKLNIQGKESEEVEFAKFFNIYEPEKNPRVINLVRALVRKTVQQRFDLNDANVVYAEQFAQFFLRFTLTAARADLGAPAMDAGEKVMRLYLHEKGPNKTNPGYGNIKAVALRRALGLDFFAGTYVLTSEYKNQILRKVKSTPTIKRADGTGRDLAGDEEVFILHPRDVIETENGRKVLRPSKEKTRKFYQDLPEEERRQHANIDNYITTEEFVKATITHEGENVIITYQKDGNEITFNLAEERQRLEDYYNDLYGKRFEIIPNIEQVYNASQPGTYNGSIQLTVREWNTAEYTQAASHKQVVVKRHRDGTVEVTEELGSDDIISLGTDKEGKTIRLKKENNEQVALVEKVVYRTSRVDPETKKVVKGLESIDLNQDEYYVPEIRAICKYPDGKIVQKFTIEEEPIYSGKEKYIVKKTPRQKSTLKVMQDMHRAAQEFSKAKDNEEAQKEVYKNYGDSASQLAYKTDTMRQYASNHLGRIFQLFHEELQKEVIDIDSIIKGWDPKKERWIVDESKIQDIFTEQLYKRRRYAYRTYGIYMGERIRGIAQHDNNQFEDMTVAEHLFGRAVLDTFRRKDGTIDYEFLSTQEGIGELFKTELLMRLAAEEAKLDDKTFPEKGMYLHLKFAYRDAIQRAIASGQIIDEDHPEKSKFKMESFQGRKISADPDEHGHDYMDIYEHFTHYTKTGLLKKDAKWKFWHEIAPGGLWDAVKEFVKGTAKG